MKLINEDEYLEKLAHSLLFDLRIDQGGWNPNGRRQPIQGVMEKGGRIITYTYDADAPANREDATNVQAIESGKRKSIEHALREIERVANVKFRCKGHKGFTNKADIQFFQGVIAPDKGEERYGITISNLKRSIVIFDTATKASSESWNGVATHEILHAMGVSHPDGDSYHKSANTDLTIMSSNFGKHEWAGLGPLDVAALQYIYGKPKTPNQSRNYANDLIDGTIIYSGNPVSLDLSDRSMTGNLVMDLRKERVANHIVGKLADPASPETKVKPIRASLAPGTRVKDIRSGKCVQLDVVGNELANRLHGGDNNDCLTPYSGKDILTGAGGKDWFILNSDSGFENVITDYRPEEGDRLLFTKDTLDWAGLKYRADFELDGRRASGTEVQFMNKSGQIVSSVIIKDMKAEEAAKQIYEWYDKPTSPPSTPNVLSENSKLGKK